MDMVFRADERLISTGHAPANFTTVKYTAQNSFDDPRPKNPWDSNVKSPHTMTSSS